MIAHCTSRRSLLKASLAGTAVAALRVPTPPVVAQATPTGSGRIPLNDALANLTPESVFEHFHQLTQIPRPSHHEAEVSAFVAEFGRGLDLETEVDEVGNVIIRKPATARMDDRQGVVLQAHMDMVPVKTAESDHNFETDPIDAYVEEGWIRADGTTLGADNGIGVAMIMAALEAGDVAHGPLEGLFTVNEEDGFTGAGAVQPGVLKGSLLINVDSEEEGIFTIGCAGGVDVDATLSYAEDPTPAGMAGVRLSIGGLQGGHSGIDIDKGRGNAIKLLARLLNDLADGVQLRLATMTGGDRYNAIPREATADIALPETQLAVLQERVKALAATVQAELVVAEPEMRIEATPVELPAAVMEANAQRRLIDALNGCPNGVIRMSDSVPGLVETSTNLGTVVLGDGEMQAGLLVRSSIDSARDAVRDSVASVFALAEAETSFHDEYSGWTPNPDSPLLTLMRGTYRDVFGTEAQVAAVHAGLETSKFAETYPDMDMISLGPTIQYVHSPDEQLDVASVGKTWTLLLAALERIPT
jgi:dipeptidase D